MEYIRGSGALKEIIKYMFLGYVSQSKVLFIQIQDFLLMAFRYPLEGIVKKMLGEEFWCM